MSGRPGSHPRSPLRQRQQHTVWGSPAAAASGCVSKSPYISNGCLHACTPTGRGALINASGCLPSVSRPFLTRSVQDCADAPVTLHVSSRHVSLRRISKMQAGTVRAALLFRGSWVCDKAPTPCCIQSGHGAGMLLRREVSYRHMNAISTANPAAAMLFV